MLKNFVPVCALESWHNENAEVFLVRTHLDVQIRVFPIQPTRFPLLMSPFEKSDLTWNNPLKVVDCLPCSGILMGQTAIRHGEPRYSNTHSFSCSCFIFPHSVCWLLLCTLGWLFLQNILKRVLYIRVRVTIVWKWQKCKQYRRISKHDCIFLQNKALIYSVRFWMDGVDLWDDSFVWKLLFCFLY